MKQIIMGVVVAMAMTVMAETSNTVKVTKFHQSYPYSGKATVEYTVGGTLPANAVAEIILNTDDASATFVQSNIVTGANSHVIDFASSFGGAMLLTNASFVVTITEGLGGVQLWENGPYWAECNVGATKPEEYGYYFWWGDTVGYTNTGSGWISVKDGTSILFTYSGMAASTYEKDNAALLSAGYIDSTGNLVAAHDAATAHLGSSWRMPTDAEFSALIDNCVTTWITTNGVSGRLVTGKGTYANRSIFLPAAGRGYDSSLDNIGSISYYWSSTPTADFSDYAWYLGFNLSGFYRNETNRFYGRSVRPVRGACSAVGIVTYDPSFVTKTQTTPVLVPYAWLDAHIPGVVDEPTAYEAAAKATAANGWKVWECYVVGLDPQDATSDFRISSFPMKADGTPDLASVAFDPPREQWNVPDAPVTWKGAATLEGPWRMVSEEGGSPGTARPTMQFFKAEVRLIGVPGGVTASSGSSAAVNLTWSTVADATGYEVWRGTGATTNGAERIAIVSNATSYADTTAVEGTTYRYWIRSVSGDVYGVFSEPVVGMRLVDPHQKVQLWAGGPYWATTNIGAENPEDYGYYFWWGDTVGYRRENNAWVASDGSSSNISFSNDIPTCDKSFATLHSEGWITTDGVLVPEYDAAHVKWGGKWRMPTYQEMSGLYDNCDWVWTTTNGVNGYVVSGRGDYASASICVNG